MLARYRNLAVKHKLRLIILFAVVAAVVPASVAVVTYDQLADRQAMRSDLDVLAEIIGSNSTAAVTFGDRRAAEELLSGLKAKKHIVAAVIYAVAGKPFASYRRDSAPPGPLPALRSIGSRFEGDRLIVYRDIQLASQTAGAIYLESDLGELHQRFARFSWTVFVILLISSAAGDGPLLQAPARGLGAHCALGPGGEKRVRPEKLHRARGETVRRRSRAAHRFLQRNAGRD